MRRYEYSRCMEKTANKIYDGDGPIQNGRVALYLKAKASTSKTPCYRLFRRDIFILVPRYLGIDKKNTC
jgi:hypothetical protein